jgi:putative flippase GtrA
MGSKAARGEIILVIPCHRPSEHLPEIVTTVLKDPDGPQAAVIVDDGNGPDATVVLSRLESIRGVTLLRHAVNMGMGAALKTGFQHALGSWPGAIGIVAADADAQHAAVDIVRVTSAMREHPGRIVLGARQFRNAPLRSRVGNEVTAILFRLFTGHKLVDTQTGLRGWPRAACARNVHLAIDGFDYQLECLLAAKEPFLEIPIQTIYLDGNKSSHFNPIADSMRIYFVLLRYCGSSIAGTLIDSAIFYPMYFATGNLIASQAAARGVAAVAIFFLVRNVVFHSHARLFTSFVRFMALVIVSGLISYSLIGFLHQLLGLNVPIAKIMSESVLFIGNFAVQRVFIFAKDAPEEPA